MSPSRRTLFVDYDARRTPKTEVFCLHCQRDILDIRRGAVRVRTAPHGEPFLVHPEDATAEDGWGWLGPECKARYDAAFIVPTRKASIP